MYRTVFIHISVFVVWSPFIEIQAVMPRIDGNVKDHKFLYYHVPKASGTEMSHFIKKYLSHTLDICPGPWCCTNFHQSYSKSFNDSRCNLVFYEGGSWMLESFPTLHLQTLMMLRNPLMLRLSGLLHCEKLHPDTYQVHNVLQNLAVGKALTKDCYNLTNMQTQLLTCPWDEGGANHYATTWFAPCGGNLSQAIEALSSAFFVGVTEHFTASFCLLLYQLDLESSEFWSKVCIRSCEIQYTAPHQNSAKAVQEKFSYEELKLLESHNLLDLELYAHALTIFRARIAEVQQITGVRLC